MFATFVAAQAEKGGEGCTHRWEMPDEDWLRAFENSLEAGPQIVKGTNDLNRACDHIVELLRESVVLFRMGSPRAVFLAITAIEETAKVHVGMYRRGLPVKRRRDPLFNHVQKHLLSAAPTIGMGRLRDVLGSARVSELLAAARAGSLIEKRESSLYADFREKKLRTPTDTITRGESRELILLAIETFDDALVGYTDHSFALSAETDKLFTEVADA